LLTQILLRIKKTKYLLLLGKDVTLGFLCALFTLTAEISIVDGFWDLNFADV
jgi:hypothetical protein